MKRLLALMLTLATAFAAGASTINDKYLALGGASGFLGAPTIPESTAPDGVGKYRHYEGGSVYFHPEVDVHEVHGMIRERWAELGWEQGFLGYPMTDEVDLADQSGRVTKFQGGEVIWKQATNSVSVVKSTDLVVDLPFPAGVAWEISHANALAGEHHQGPWAYCWDFNLAGAATGKTAGQPFVSIADAKVAYVQENLDGEPDNVVTQRLGEGRYASYLHLAKGGYTKKTATGSGIHFLPQEAGWASAPMMPTGKVLGTIGFHDHLHFCITTSPDRPAFAPFESVPIAFRNYSFSTNQGKSWTFVPVGVPRRDQWVRREAAKAGVKSQPEVNASVSVISHGTVGVQIKASGGKPAGKGRFTVALVTAWGEELKSKQYDVQPGSLSGPWSFTFTNVPAYPQLRLQAKFEGPWDHPADWVHGEGEPFDLAPGKTVSKSIAVKAIFIH